MTYTIYKTEGIVLSKKDFGEADRIFAVFTKDFGKIRAVARGVRLLKSKLRYNLDLFACVRLGLIAGRDFWRIVDVDPCGAPHLGEGDEEKVKLFAKISLLLDRMLQGEQRDIPLWSIVRKVYFDIERRGISKDKYKELEIKAAVKILSRLGYLERENFSSREEAIRAVNRAIKESML